MGRRRTGTATKSIFGTTDFRLTFADYAGLIVAFLICMYLWSKTTTFGEKFVTVSHNVTEYNLQGKDPILFETGFFDMHLTFFCACAIIIVQDLLHEGLWDRIVRRINLRKELQPEFTMSLTHLVYLFALICSSLHLVLEAGLIRHPSQMWVDYPHNTMTMAVKIFFVAVVAYWVHVIPVMFVNKPRKSDVKQRVVAVVSHLAIAFTLYLANLTRMGLVLILLHSIGDFTHYLAQVLAVAAAAQPTRKSSFFKSASEHPLQRAAAVAARVASRVSVPSKVLVVVVAIFTASIGLPSQAGFDLSTGNFNSPLLRLALLVAIVQWQVGGYISALLFANVADEEQSSEVTPSVQAATPAKAALPSTATTGAVVEAKKAKKTQ